MAKVKLPNITKNVTNSLKPMRSMVKSITSKLKGNKIKVPKLKKVSTSASKSLLKSGLSGLQKRIRTK